jgi:hypothetical protein
MHTKKGIGSDWIWPIFRRSGNRLATNENEVEMHSKTEFFQAGSGQYTEELQPTRIMAKCIQKRNLFGLDLATIQKWKQACNQ